MKPVAEQVRGTRTSREKKRCRRHVALRRVTGRAGEDEVVASVVGRLPATRGHVIERHRGATESIATVRAHGTMLGKEPGARVGVCRSAGGMRRQLWLVGVRRFAAT